MKGSAITGPVAKECVRPLLSWGFLVLRLTAIFGYTGRSLAPYRLKRWYRGLSASFLLFRCPPVHYIVAIPLHNKHMKCTAGEYRSENTSGTSTIK